MVYHKQFGLGLPWWLRRWRICLQCERPGFNPWVGKIPWGREWLPTPVFLPGELHGQRSPVGYRPWGGKESDTTKWLIHTHTHTHTHTHSLTQALWVRRKMALIFLLYLYPLLISQFKCTSDNLACLVFLSLLTKSLLLFWEELGRPQSMGSHRARHDWANNSFTLLQSQTHVLSLVNQCPSGGLGQGIRFLAQWESGVRLCLDLWGTGEFFLTGLQRW